MKNDPEYTPGMRTVLTGTGADFVTSSSSRSVAAACGSLLQLERNLELSHFAAHARPRTRSSQPHNGENEAHCAAAPARNALFGRDARICRGGDGGCGSVGGSDGGGARDHERGGRGRGGRIQGAGG
jgi:hypothetical protein